MRFEIWVFTQVAGVFQILHTTMGQPKKVPGWGGRGWGPKDSCLYDTVCRLFTFSGGTLVT